MRGVGVVALVAVAFLAGVVAGGFGPREEARALRRELFEAERAGSGLGGADLARMVTERLVPEPAPRGKGPVAAADGRDLAEVLEEAQAADPSEDGPVEPPPALPQAFDPTQVDAAREAMLLRATQARAALDQELEPTDEQARAIDAAIDNMNDRLVDLSYGLADQVRTGSEMNRPAVTRLVADVLTTMADAEDALRATMTPEQAGDVPAEMTDPLSFVDPAVLDVLADIDPEAFRGAAP